MIDNTSRFNDEFLRAALSFSELIEGLWLIIDILICYNLARHEIWRAPERFLHSH